MTAPRMTRPEAVMLCRFAKASCPQQQFDEFTPDAWFELLNDLRFDDCKAAVVAVVKRQPFCSPSEIRAEVKRIRFKRIDDFGQFDPPSGLEDYRGWMRGMYERIGDGLTREEFEAERPALVERDMRAIEGTFRAVDDEGAA